MGDLVLCNDDGSEHCHDIADDASGSNLPRSSCTDGYEWPFWTKKAEIHAKRQHHARSLVITPNPGEYFRILKDNS